jgi:hypothetical protein
MNFNPQSNTLLSVAVKEPKFAEKKEEFCIINTFICINLLQLSVYNSKIYRNNENIYVCVERQVTENVIRKDVHRKLN